MDEQLKQKLLEYASGLESAVNSSTGLAEQEIPATIQQYLAFMFVEGLFWTITFLVLIPIIWLIVFKLHKQSEKTIEKGRLWDEYDHNGLIFFSTGIGIILSFIMGTIGLNWGIWTLKVMFAPKVVLLEKIVQLIN